MTTVVLTMTTPMKNEWQKLHSYMCYFPGSLTPDEIACGLDAAWTAIQERRFDQARALVQDLLGDQLNPNPPGVIEIPDYRRDMEWWVSRLTECLQPPKVD